MLRKNIVSLLASFAALCALNAVGAAEQPVPNILLIYVDDMGIGDTSAYQGFTGLPDNRQMHTPRIDRLAAQGVLFTDAHSAGSLCSPSRWSLMSGRYCWRHPDVQNNLLHDETRSYLEDEVTLPQVLKEAGYRTYGAGKWHVGVQRSKTTNQSGRDVWGDDLEVGPLDLGFDHYTGTAQNAGGKRTWVIHQRKVCHLDDQGNPVVGQEDVPMNRLSQLYLDQSERYLAEHASGGKWADRPFFLYYAPNANHAPYEPVEKLNNRPVAGQARVVSGQPASEAIDDFIDQQRPGMRIHPKHRSDLVYENDVAVGILLDWLAELDDPRRPGHKLSENTVVIFSSDNGSDVRTSNVPPHGHLSGHKDRLSEGGHRVPLVVHWHGRIEGGAVSDAVISHVDLFRTLATLGKAKMPDGAAQDSVDLTEHLLHSDQTFVRPDDHPLTCLSRGKHRLAIRRGPWKLSFAPDVDVVRGTGTAVSLVNLKEDITERTNLIENPKYKSVLDQLKADFTKMCRPISAVTGTEGWN